MGLIISIFRYLVFLRITLIISVYINVFLSDFGCSFLPLFEAFIEFNFTTIRPSNPLLLGCGLGFRNQPIIIENCCLHDAVHLLSSRFVLPGTLIKRIWH